jgi:hypothetical protein
MLRYGGQDAASSDDFSPEGVLNVTTLPSPSTACSRPARSCSKSASQRLSPPPTPPIAQGQRRPLIAGAYRAWRCR